MTWNVLASAHIDDAGPRSISDIAEITYLSNDEELGPNALQNINGIILSTREITSELIKQAERLKVISKYGVGVDSINLKAATAQNVIVCNAPGSNAQAVAEHTIGLLLAARKQLHAANNDLQNGEWDRRKYIAPELRGDVLGLYGCGTIAKKVVQFARPFGLDCVAYDPYLNEYDVPPGVSMVESITELFTKSDIVSIHAPLTDTTHQSVSHNEFKALSESGILVNTARGGIVDEPALVDALKQNNIMGAGIDVFFEEPVTNNELVTLNNVVATPHLGGATIESNREKSMRAAENIRTVYEGDIPRTTVNINGIFDLPSK